MRSRSSLFMEEMRFKQSEPKYVPICTYLCTKIFNSSCITIKSFLINYKLGSSLRIVSKQTAKTFQEYFTQFFHYQPGNCHFWLRFTLVAWLTALYDQIWLPRNKLTCGKNNTIIPLNGEDLLV
jgi:hypothetical protein